MKHSHSSSHIAALDGLRFIAALCVLVAHYSQWLIHDAASQSVLKWVTPLSGFGMALFFTLSGFVIHYNYSGLVGTKGGTKKFLIARFARLYPLFFVLVAIDVTMSLGLGTTPCARAEFDAPYEAVKVLPYYLTLTHSWVYANICRHSIIYQFGQVSAVSWSISVEIFLYLSYLFIARPLSRLNLRWQVVAALLVHALIVGYFLLCDANRGPIDDFASETFGMYSSRAFGTQDSFLRWLYYFNPISQLSGFVCGIVAANIYMKRGHIATARGSLITFATILLAFGVHLWFYNILAPIHGFIGRTASSLYMPLVAIMIYALARFAGSIPARALSHRICVKLGESSYSIYLLHALLIMGWQRFAGQLNEWLYFALCITGVLVASRLSYLYFEKPMIRLIRRRWK